MSRRSVLLVALVIFVVIRPSAHRDLTGLRSVKVIVGGEPRDRAFSSFRDFCGDSVMGWQRTNTEVELVWQQLTFCQSNSTINWSLDQVNKNKI